MSRNREITGTFVRERNAFISDDGLTRTIIGEIETAEDRSAEPLETWGTWDNQQRTTIRGEVKEGDLIPGLVYRFYGQWRTHHKYGDQFQFTGFVVETPAGQEAVETYLRQCPGIGPAKSRLAWKLWGDDAIRVVRESPDRTVKDLRITGQQAEESADLLRQKLAVEKTTVELFGLLHGRGLPKFGKLVETLIQDFGSQAALAIRRNPYLLMRYRGCGFLKTDKLWLEFGHNPARLKRQALCCWHAIANGDGDTWFPLTDARDALRENISGADVRFEDAITLGLRSGMLAQRNERGRLWIAEKRKADAEGRVARLLVGAAEDSAECGTEWPEIDGLREQKTVTDHQFQQLSRALTQQICVLAGSPGTGKTYCTAALIRLVIQEVGQNHVAACAPTGKASVRLTEGLQNNGVNLRAKTIHSLLRVVSSGGDGWGFDHNESNPLPHKFVFIDESSMIDVGLMASLLAARDRRAHFLFIGDPNQLAPVGHGAPLRDMIAAGVPTGTLTKIERNDGMIVRACADIRDRRRFSPAAKPNLDAGQNLVLIHREQPEEQIDALTRIMGQFLSGSKHDPIWDVQVLVAVNKKSPLGRKPINERLQDLLNPEGMIVKGNPFRVGDKIINGKNGWFPSRLHLEWNGSDVDSEEIATENGKVYVANGEQAEVIEVEPNRTIARLTAPDREIIIPRGSKKDDEEETSKSDGEEDQSTGTGCDWELGYAISVHKSQGSEWRFVIVLLDTYNGAKMVQTRQWLYTGISRAKTLCFLIGQQSTADAACNRDGLFKRKTFLVERIQELTLAPQTDAEPQWTSEKVGELLAGVI